MKVLVQLWIGTNLGVLIVGYIAYLFHKGKRD